MKIVHVLFAIAATYRLVEIFLLDRISLPIRNRFPSYLWSCPRCLSIWAGAACTLAYVFLPWLNWPLALSWTYFIAKDWQQAKTGRRLIVEIDQNGQWNMQHNDLQPQEVLAVFGQMTSTLKVERVQ